MVPDRGGRTSLHVAVLDGDLPRVRALAADEQQLNRADNRGFTPLHFAAQKQDAAIAELLLEAGCGVDPVDSFGNTPLWTAVYNTEDDGSVIRLLRARGADPWHRNTSGNSPVYLARLIANVDVARFFADLPSEQPDGERV